MRHNLHSAIGRQDHTQFLGLHAHHVLGADHLPAVELPVSSRLGDESLWAIHHKAVFPVVGHNRPADHLDGSGSGRHHIHHQVDVLHVFEVGRDRASCVHQQNRLIGFRVGQDGVVGVTPVGECPPCIGGRSDVMLSIEELLIIWVGADDEAIQQDVTHTGGLHLEDHHLRRHRLTEVGHDGRIARQFNFQERVLDVADDHVA